MSAQSFYFIRQTDSGLAFDGRNAFQMPPVPLLDGDHRSPFGRNLYKSAYTGQPTFIKHVKPPNPDPQEVELCRGVGLVELIYDDEDQLVGLSKAYFKQFERELRGSLGHLYPVSLYRYPGKRSAKIRPQDYWLGTIRWRDIVVHWCDFPNSQFDLVNFSDFDQHGTKVMTGEIELGTPYPLVESACCFEDIVDYKNASQFSINKLQTYIPTQLSLKTEEVPALFNFDAELTLIREDLAKGLSCYTKPGVFFPYQPVRVFQSTAY